MGGGGLDPEYCNLRSIFVQIVANTSLKKNSGIEPPRVNMPVSEN